MNKKGYEFNFAWIFAIIIGAAAISFAVYAVTQLIETKNVENQATRAKEISTLLNPIGTNLGSSRFARIIVSDTTILENNCIAPTPSEPFGKQELSTILASLSGKRSEDLGVPTTLRSQYLFSPESLEAEDEFYVLSKPLNLPFKVADIIMMWSDKTNYCFLSPGQKIKDDVDDSNMENVFYENCPDDSITVCFSRGADRANCDIVVTSDSVIHDTETIDYVDLSAMDRNNPHTLLYAAIFSDKKTYDCQISRIFGRIKKLSEIYKAKSETLTSEGCSSAPELPNALSSLSSANSLSSVLDKAITLKEKNDRLTCRLF